jgi:hypothetical protein
VQQQLQLSEQQHQHQHLEQLTLLHLVPLALALVVSTLVLALMQHLALVSKRKKSHYLCLFVFCLATILAKWLLLDGIPQPFGGFTLDTNYRSK